MTSLKIDTIASAGTVTVEVSGEVDMAVQQRLMAAVGGLLRRRP